MTDAQMATLMNHLVAWLKQQPEWPLLLAGDRNERRRVADEVARTVTTIPQVDHAMLVQVTNGRQSVIRPANRRTRRHVLVKEEE